MRKPVPFLSCLAAVLLLAGCDGTSHHSVTAPPLIPAPSATLTYAGTATVAGVGSAAPAGDCAAAAIRSDVGRTWDFQLELTDSGDGRTGTGRLTSPLLSAEACDFTYGNPYGELGIHPSVRCNTTYREWTYGSACADAATAVQLIFMQVDAYSPQAAVLRGAGRLTFERSPAPSYDLEIQLNFDLRRQ